MPETLEPNVTYLPQHIEVNRTELIRIQQELDDVLARGWKLYGRLDQLIKQGSTPRKED